MRVLVGYDGSASADQALALVAGAAWPAGSECRIVVACGVPTPSYGTSIPTYAPGVVAEAPMPRSMYDAQAEDAERLATAACERLARPDLAVTQEVGVGRPASVILNLVERFAPDLLVVGSRGLGPLTSALLGSVSEELVRTMPPAQSSSRVTLFSGECCWLRTVRPTPRPRARSCCGRFSERARCEWSASPSVPISVRRPRPPYRWRRPRSRPWAS